MRTHEQIQELTSDLYYDLLDKYVLLKKNYDEFRNQHVKLKLKLCNANILNSTEIDRATNKQIDVFLRLARKHRCSIEYINELTNLKSKPNNTENIIS